MGTQPPVLAGERQVQIGRYRGWIQTQLLSIAISFPHVQELVTQLDVLLPVGHGRCRDLAVGAARLSDKALIRITASALASDG